MNREQYSSLAKQIMEISKKNLLIWSPTSYTNTYQAKLGKGAVSVYYVGDDCSSLNYDEIVASLTFENERGETFGGIYCKDTTDPDYTTVKGIYDNANDSYMKISDTLKSMMDYINLKTKK